MLGAGLGEHPGLLQVPGRLADVPPFLVDVGGPVPAGTPGRFPVGFQGPVAVDLVGEVVHVPGVRTVLAQRGLLRRGGVKPVTVRHTPGPACSRSWQTE